MQQKDNIHEQDNKADHNTDSCPIYLITITFFKLIKIDGSNRPFKRSKMNVDCDLLTAYRGKLKFRAWLCFESMLVSSS